MPGVCARCGKKVYAAEEKLALGESWHIECFTCAICNRSLDSISLAENCETGEIYCKACYQRVFATKGYGYGPLEPTLLVMDCPSIEQIGSRTPDRKFEPPPSRLGHTYSSTCPIPGHYEKTAATQKAPRSASTRGTKDEQRNSLDRTTAAASFCNKQLGSMERSPLLKPVPKSCFIDEKQEPVEDPPAFGQSEPPTFRQNENLRATSWNKIPYNFAADKTNKKDSNTENLKTENIKNNVTKNWRELMENVTRKKMSTEEPETKEMPISNEPKTNDRKSYEVGGKVEQGPLSSRPKIENQSFNGLNGCNIGECVGGPAYPRYPPAQAKCPRVPLGPNAFDRNLEQDNEFDTKKNSVKNNIRGDICTRCGRPVFFAEMKRSYHGVYHTECFTCCTCRKPLEATTISENQGEIFCKGCYRRLFGIHGVGFGVGSGVLQTP